MTDDAAGDVAESLAYIEGKVEELRDEVEQLRGTVAELSARLSGRDLGRRSDVPPLGGG